MLLLPSLLGNVDNDRSCPLPPSHPVAEIGFPWFCSSGVRMCLPSNYIRTGWHKLAQPRTTHCHCQGSKKREDFHDWLKLIQTNPQSLTLLILNEEGGDRCQTGNNIVHCRAQLLHFQIYALTNCLFKPFWIEFLVIYYKSYPVIAATGWPLGTLIKPTSCVFSITDQPLDDDELPGLFQSVRPCSSSLYPCTTSSLSQPSPAHT